jgi:hypothetical protein
MLNFPRTTHYRKLDHDSMVIVLNIDPTVEYAEGTPCYWDAANGVAKPIPASDTVTDVMIEAYCGLAQNTNPVKYHAPIKKMAFYIGDVIARLFMHAGENIDHFTPVFPGDQIGVTSVAPSMGVTKPLGHVILDAEEYKVARATLEGEEVSTLLRQSIFKTRSF